MSGRIVLFGATGYTGELTARVLVDRGAKPVLAGRDAARLDALARELGGGLETTVADVSNPATIEALVERGDVLISTVGPFAKLGHPAVEAAIAAGAHYLDSTGEGAFIREVFERYGPQAEQAEAGLLTAFGYDWVPGNLAGALALTEAGEAATRVEIGYFATGDAGLGAASGGTRATIASGALGSSYAWRGARLVGEPTARHVRSFDLGRSTSDAFSVGSSEAFALPRHSPAVRDVGVYLGWAGPLSRAVQAMSAGAHVLGRIPGAHAALQAAMKPFAPSGSSGGPDAEARAKVGSLVVAEAFDARGTQLSAVRLKGVNPYDFTAAVLAWGAQTAADQGLQRTGALGPVDGFGLEALIRGVAEAGISRT